MRMCSTGAKLIFFLPARFLKMSLLSDAESDPDFQLTINEHYAKAFQHKKEREELEQLKLKYGSDEEDDDSETDSEEDESEDEDGEELTPAVDAAILRTLARIKRRDPEIYNTKVGIFEEEQKTLGPTNPISKQPKVKSKPVTMRQVAIEAQLQPDSRSPSPELLTHTEEQQRLRDETIAAFHQVGDDDNEDDDLFVSREKTKDEQEREEEEYRSFLEREVGGDLKALVTVEESTWKDEALPAFGIKKTKKKKKGKDHPEKAEDAQEFLMNYILNRGWIDRSANRVPTYREVVSPKSQGKRKVIDETEGAEDENPEEDKDIHAVSNSEVDEEEFEDIVDRFESSYNFRFEEPNAAVIPAHPRQIPSLVRREDTTRKEARERRKNRREEEIQKKREEVKILKGLKMKELRMKLDQIGKQGGKSLEDDLALQDLDLEGDWDPGAHDRQMAGLYGDDAEYDEDGKPTWEDDIDIGDIHVGDESGTTRKKNKKKKKGEDDEGSGVYVDAMDADVEKADDEWDGTEEMRKRKVEEYMDEVYGLDFNDMVGGMPTRFHYTHVDPKDFHLTPAEILMATDAELNEYMGIKKFAPYRKPANWDSNRGDRLKELKHKIGERGYGGETTKDDKPAKKRKGKKERQKMKTTVVMDIEKDMEKEAEASEKGTMPGNSKRKRLSGEMEAHDDVEEASAQKKRRRRHKKKDIEDAP
ncbi:KRI1-like family C-terminal-domain-containing protein [Lentinula aciculospora]|uniref:KRI1-like family C-terminal-domain-containing protein n=1 Tax=Lentinula aciculospora TaxID=153920 RepID=A0A9W9AK73_9AGAR|nr:KRI1-like family C-terminal-domain-containing protein [Lentinula aciculospora]